MPSVLPRWARTLGVATLLSLAFGVGPSATASADGEVYDVPPSGVFAFDGRGYGHGRGLSQWGAQGRATEGESAEQILLAYYPGTSLSAAGRAVVRVLIVEDEGRDLDVRAQPGFTLFDRASGRRFRLPDVAGGWRIVSRSSGLVLQRATNGRWEDWRAPSGITTFRGPLRLAGPDPIRLRFDDGTARDYAGSLEAVRTGPGRLLTVNRVSLERYLYDVVGREMPLYFDQEALKAQAIAARTYALNRVIGSATRPRYDICSSSDDCQTYGGIRFIDAEGRVHEHEAPRVKAAVDATRGVVLTYRGRPIYAEFSASNGGWSRAWTGWPPRPYLVAVPDVWDAAVSPYHTWSARVSANQIQLAYPRVGQLLRIRITERDGAGPWNGRVTRLRLEGVSAAGEPTSVTVSGDDFVQASAWPGAPAGLRSTWWVIR